MKTKMEHSPELTNSTFQFEHGRSIVDMPPAQKMEGNATSSVLDSPVRSKAAIVTGASRGIGRGIAQRLLETCYCVVANSRNIMLSKTLQPGDRLKLIDGDIGSHAAGGI